MIKAIIFDMDGVLLDSMPMHLKVWKEMFEKRSIPFSLKIFEEYNGISTKEIAELLIEKYGLDDSVEGMVEEKHSKERVLARKMVKLFDNSLSTIKRLKSEGFLVGIATSALKETVDYVNKTFKLDRYVDKFTYSAEVERTKPDPGIFLLTAKKLGVDPRECAVVEDAIKGIEAANRAGMISIAITNTFPREDFEDADMIIDSLDELDKKLLDGE